MKRTRQEKLRLGFMLLVICTFFALIIIRLFHFQVVLADEYSAIVERQSSGKVPIPATRGIIFDRNGNVVANNIFLSSLYAYPKTLEELKNVCRYLEKTYQLPRNSAKKKYGLGIKKFRWIERKIKDSFTAQIEKNAPVGLYLRKEAKRVYPYGLVGKQIFGFTNIDNKGQSGFEYASDSVLSGLNGWADIRRDGLRNTFRVKEKALVKPISGQSIVLTIDMRLQEIVESELIKAVMKNNAKSGMAVFIDCNNGDVLAMTHYDPNEKNKTKPVKLRVVTDQFEPGSIFKVITAAALLDRNLIDFNDSIYCEQGLWKINRNRLHDDKPLEWLNFRKIIELSSNIGLAKYAINLGGDEILQTSYDFGFGSKVLNCMPGETKGKMSAPPTWSDYNTAAFSIGHSIAVSSIQMVSAFGAIANGGTYIPPRLILGRVDENGFVVDRRDKTEYKRVIGKSTSDSLCSFMQGVVEMGTAEAAYSSVMTIGGKTGTAQIFDVENRRYYRNKYMASFAGFFPVEKPLIAGIVVLEEPQPVHYGGWTAGPVFKDIAKNYAVINPDLFTTPQTVLHVNDNDERSTVEVPDLIGKDYTEAQNKIENHDLVLRINNSDGTVAWQYPPPDRLLFRGDEVLAVTRNRDTGSIRMIDLKGLSIREVSAFCNYTGLKYEFDGKGKAVRQSIKPGCELTEKSFCRIKFRQI